MEAVVRARPLVPLVAAGGLLVAGTAVYVVGRDAFGALGGVLPDFAHAAAFAILSALALGASRRGAWTGGLAWAALAGAFEIAVGTFDPADLLAIAAGCAGGALVVRACAGSGRARRTRLAPVLLLGAATTLASYGPAPGEVTCTTDPEPTIRSSPPTVATVGHRYVYYVDALWACFFGLCNSVDGVSLPPGAEIDDFYDSVSWTPPPEAVNTNARFVIETEADFCNDHARQAWTVHVYPASQISAFSADPPSVLTGQSTQLLAVFEGSGAIEGLGPVTSGVAVSTPPLSFTRDFRLVVTNEVGAPTYAVLTVAVVAPPAIGFMSAYPFTVTPGASSTLSWSVSGFYTSARIEPGGVDVTGIAQLAVTPAAYTVYTLTLYLGTQAVASASVGVDVLPAPVIAAFTVAPATVALHGDVTLTAQFSGGAGEVHVDRGYALVPLGAATSGASIADADLLRTTTYRLTVRNAAAEVTRELTVPVTGPGTFQRAAGEPLEPLRARHTATRLLDGRVLIAGDALGTELFDPVAGTFAPGPALPERLRGMAAAPLPDGRVLLLGGIRPNGWRSLDAYLYEPAANALKALGRIPQFTDLVTPRAVALLDGRVLTVHPSLGQDSELFDPATETFSYTGPMHVAHTCIEAIRLGDGRVAIVEGLGGASELYAPDTGTFSTLGSMLKYRCDFAHALLPNDRVLVTGGSAIADPAEVLDPATGQFSLAGRQAYPPNRSPTATRLAAGVLVVGGTASLPAGSGYSPMAELFDPASGEFTLTGGLREGRYDHTATLLQDGRVLVVGGCREPPCAAELYTPP